MDLQTRWERCYRRYIGRKEYLTLTPGLTALSRELTRAIRLYVSGRLLDAGAGPLTYTFLLMPRAAEYVSIDIEPADPRLTARADVCHLPFASGSFDTIVCTQVLEHVPRPWEAMREFARVLRLQGTLLITAPHLSYIHGAPQDYYRYTQYGLGSLAADAGMKVKETRPAGGLLCFVASPVSVILNALLGPVPGLARPTQFLNGLFVRVVVGLDRYLGLRDRYPINWVAVFVKETDEAQSERAGASATQPRKRGRSAHHHRQP